MKVSFQLTMPNVGSWNGKWTGADKKYYIVRSYRGHEANRILGKFFQEGKKAGFRYDFGDGWSAAVTMEVVETKEGNKRKKISAGFCRYEWMVDEILKHGRILTREERHQQRQTETA